ncbi:MAG: Mur ligase family protein [Candidatus Rhabdochlamydia sp.]
MNFETLLADLFSRRRDRRFHNQFVLHHPLKEMRNPHQKYPSIHIAGTNGKGSVATKLANVFELSGYKVGLFTSPHLDHFEERIQVNHTLISKDFIFEYLPHLMKRYPGLSFFDYTALLGFAYFAEQKVEIAIIEAGMGGLYDSTNYLLPLLSIITTIALDHTDILGVTLEEIAFQKSGIIKPLTPVVLGPKAAYLSVIKTAQSLHAPCTVVPFTKGGYQEENALIAKTALSSLPASFHLDPLVIEQGVKVNPLCRFERKGRFVLDVAHNYEGVEHLLALWDEHYLLKPFNAIVSFSLDKDLKSCLLKIASRAHHLFLIPSPSSRGALPTVMAAILQTHLHTNFTVCQTIQMAIEEALACKPDILVCGSFYIMQDVREQILRL